MSTPQHAQNEIREKVNETSANKSDFDHVQAIMRAHSTDLVICSGDSDKIHRRAPRNELCNPPHPMLAHHFEGGHDVESHPQLSTP